MLEFNKSQKHVAIAGATTNNIVIKCMKWDNTNNESKRNYKFKFKCRMHVYVCMYERLSGKDCHTEYKITHLYSILNVMLQRH